MFSPAGNKSSSMAWDLGGNGALEFRAAQQAVGAHWCTLVSLELMLVRVHR
ncbi:hypothetical protein SAMN05421748_1478 [Paractinoplanes atraurantiacus]|uniref:Uncharacterized protein n=1 Tax=Paractinoplanes atraurantiacus TaxID=1036182 RepID=A0A285KNH9_9ACTN|nr:hypothetical protein SAMN05421748_1478 [Actinoplanes atraurantiacus]